MGCLGMKSFQFFSPLVSSTRNTKYIYNLLSDFLDFFHSMSGFGMNRNQAFGMNNSLSSNIFNGTGEFTLLNIDLKLQ